MPLHCEDLLVRLKYASELSRRIRRFFCDLEETLQRFEQSGSAMGRLFPVEGTQVVVGIIFVLSQFRFIWK